MLDHDIVYDAFFPSLMNICCHDAFFLKAFVDMYKNYLYQILYNDVRMLGGGIHYPFVVNSFLSTKHQFKERKKK